MRLKIFVVFRATRIRFSANRKITRTCGTLAWKPKVKKHDDQTINVPSPGYRERRRTGSFDTIRRFESQHESGLGDSDDDDDDECGWVGGRAAS